MEANVQEPVSTPTAGANTVDTNTNQGGYPTSISQPTPTTTGGEQKPATNENIQAPTQQQPQNVVHPESNPGNTETNAVMTQYEPFTVPEGFDAPMEDFKTWALGAKLTQEQAQGAVDFYCKTIMPQMAKKQEEIIQQWKTQTNAQLGSQGITQAMKALDKLADKNALLKPFLQDSGLINHPVIMGLLCDLSTHLLEGTAGIPYNTNTPFAQKTLAQSLFPNSLR